MSRKQILILLAINLCCVWLSSGCQVEYVALETAIQTSPVISSTANSMLAETETPFPVHHDVTKTAISTSQQTDTVVPPTPTKQLPTNTPVPVPADTIDNTGPWFAYFEKEEGSIVVINADASGRKIILTNLSTIPHPRMIGSSSNFLAVVSEWEELSDEYFDKTSLIIIELPSGEIREVIPLITNSDIPKDEEYLAALGFSVSFDSLAWSPDGQHLAFIAAIEGPSADLYVYDVSTGKYRRMSFGSNRASSPQWSPNGKWIVHSESKNVSEMCDMIAVWAASLETEAVNHLFDESCGYAILNWTSPENFLSFSEQNVSIQEIKSVSVKGYSVSLIPFHAWISDERAIAANPKTGMVAFGAFTEVEHEPISGIFLTLPADPNAYATVGWHDFAYPVIEWVPGWHSFVAYPHTEKCGVAIISEQGVVTCLHDEDFAYITPGASGDHELNLVGMTVSPDGEKLIIGSSEGLFLYDENLQRVELRSENGESVRIKGNLFDPIWCSDEKCLALRTSDNILYIDIANQSVISLSNRNDNFSYGTWSDDSKNLFLEVDDNLYYFDKSQNEPLFIDDNVSWFSYTWVGQ